jgi:hypothetical protein
MGTRNNPGKYDCYAKAEPDEPMFILLGRDTSAPEVISQWATHRELEVKLGLRPLSDLAVIAEARVCAGEMVKWRLANRVSSHERDPLLMDKAEE